MFSSTLGAREGQPGPVSLSLLAEAMAQAILLAFPPDDPNDLRLVGLDEVVMRQEMQVGDRVLIEVERQGQYGRLSRFRCRMLRGGSVVAEGKITVGH